MPLWVGIVLFQRMLVQIAINATRYVKSASASGSADNNYHDLDYYEYLKTLIQYFFFLSFHQKSGKYRELLRFCKDGTYHVVGCHLPLIAALYNNQHYNGRNQTSDQ